MAAVTTAATYAMADLYRELGKALLESARPPGLDADELEQYDLLLEEQAFPFEEKAIGLHERNARRTAEGLYDASVRRSLADLAQLKPARYARTESTVAPVASATAPPATAQAITEANVAYEAGDWTAAAARLTAVLSVDPANAAAVNRLGVTHRQLGEFVEARAGTAACC